MTSTEQDKNTHWIRRREAYERDMEKTRRWCVVTHRKRERKRDDRERLDEAFVQEISSTVGAQMALHLRTPARTTTHHQSTPAQPRIQNSMQARAASLSHTNLTAAPDSMTPWLSNYRGFIDCTIENFTNEATGQTWRSCAIWEMKTSPPSRGLTWLK